MKKIFTLLYTLSITVGGLTETLSLDDCIRLALANNPDLQKSEFTLEQSKISTNQAWSELYPSMSVNASTSNNGPFVSDMQDEWDWSLGKSVSQQFYSPGMYSGIRLARAQQTAAQYSDASLEDQIRASVEKLVYQILTSDTLIGVYRANIRLSEEQIGKMKQMVELGLKRESDLLKSKVQRGTFEAQLISEIETLAASKRGLNILMGRSPNTQYDIKPLDVGHIDVPEFQTALSMMLENNPSLKQLKKQVDVKKLSLGISKEAFLPSLSGSYSYSQRNDAYSRSTIENDQINLHLSLNIFDGFNKKQNVQKARLSLKEAQLDYDTALRDVDEALSNQYKGLETQNRLITIHETNLTSARKDLEVVSQQYAAGFSTILDLMDAQVSVLESETNLLKDLYTRKRIEAEIRRLIGQ